MLYILAKSSKDFQHNNLKLGNIHPESILLGGSDGGDIKVVNRYSWPN